MKINLSTLFIEKILVPDNGLPDCNPHHAIWHDRDGDSCQVSDFFSSCCTILTHIKDYYDRNWCRLPEGDMIRYANDGYSALNCPDCNKCNKVASDSSPWGKWGACSTTCGSGIGKICFIELYNIRFKQL